MSNPHANKDQCPLIEIHERREKASVLFTPPVTDLFKSYDQRSELVNAIGDEINRVPANFIPYGCIVFKGLMFVYQSFWNEEEGMFFMDIDLASKLRVVGHMKKTKFKTDNTFH